MVMSTWPPSETDARMPISRSRIWLRFTLIPPNALLELGKGSLESSGKHSGAVSMVIPVVKSIEEAPPPSMITRSTTPVTVRFEQSAGLV